MSNEFEEFTCYICQNYYTIPIFECENKHPICYLCFTQVELCPMCREPFNLIPVRNEQLEKKLMTVKLPCPNDPENCKDMFLYNELQEHNMNCEFMEIPCPRRQNNCSRVGTRKEIFEHLRVDHNFQIVKGKQWNISVSRSIDERPMGIAFECFNSNFYVTYVTSNSLLNKGVVIFYFDTDKINFESKKYEIVIKSPEAASKRRQFSQIKDGLSFTIESDTVFSVTICETAQAQ